MSTVAVQKTWGNRVEIAAFLGVHPNTVVRWAAKGLLRTRTGPGIRPMYSFEDAQRIADGQGGYIEPVVEPVAR